MLHVNATGKVRHPSARCSCAACKHCHYQVLLEQPCTWQPRSPPHQFHPGSTHSRAKQPTVPPWPGSASQELEHVAAVQHRGAAQGVNVLASAAPGGHSKQRREYHLQDLKCQCLINSLTGYTKHAKGSLLRDTKSPKSSSGARTDLEQQCNNKSSQLFIEPMQEEKLTSSFSSLLHWSPSHSHRLSCSPGFHTLQSPRVTLKGCSTLIYWLGRSTQKSNNSAA